MGEARSSGESSTAATAEEADLSFEAALDRLEGVVDRLEDGDLELGVALASFEEGVRLTRRCAEQLDAAQRRIDVLLKEGDRWLARPFAEQRAGTDVDDAEGEDLEEDPEERV